MSNSWNPENKKAIAMSRVSSAGQKDNTSSESQKRDIIEYAKANGLDLNPVTDIIVIIESASRAGERKKYSEFIKQALKQKVGHIIFHRYDRESRNLTDNEENENLIRQGKFAVHYVRDNKVLHKNSPDSDYFNRDIQAAINKGYSRDLSSKVKLGTEAKAQSGWFPGNTPATGYIHLRNRSAGGFEKQKGTTIIVDPNAKNVRLVVREFEIRAEPITPSLQQIRQRIITEGLIPIEEIKKYHVGSIERRLKNIFYDGRFPWAGKEYVGKHPRIIPTELFWKVQETFGHRNPYGKKTRGIFQNGWMKCADSACGCHIIFDPRDKKIKATGEIKTYRHYRCTNGKRIHTSTKGMRVSEEILLDQLGGAVKAITINENFKDELMKALNEAQTKARRAIKTDIENFQLSLDKIHTDEDEVYRDHKSGLLDAEAYHRQVQRLRSERMRFSEMMKLSQLQINDVTNETVNSILQLATNAFSLWIRRSPEERAVFLKKLLSNQVLDGVTVRYEIIKPLQTLSEMKTDENWRRRRDSNSR